MQPPVCYYIIKKEPLTALSAVATPISRLQCLKYGMSLRSELQGFWELLMPQRKEFG